MTFEESEKYINCAKVVVGDDGKVTQSYDACMTANGSYQLNLQSVDSPETKFLLIVRPNVKIGVKMTLHLMNKMKEGLIRLDYAGSHTNPQEWKEGVPVIFKQYAGHCFNNQTHLHKFVENYSLQWALPIEETSIEPKAISNTNVKNGWQEATDGFCGYLNIQGKITLK